MANAFDKDLMDRLYKEYLDYISSPQVWPKVSKEPPADWKPSEVPNSLEEWCKR